MGTFPVRDGAGAFPEQEEERRANAGQQWLRTYDSKLGTRPARDPVGAIPPGRFCGVPAITRVWINRPNVQRPREQQGEYPIFDVLLPDGRQLLVWDAQWTGLTILKHELDHPMMKGKAVAWIETTADIWVQLTKHGPFEKASAV